jgi:hypothetical protein
LGEKGYLLPPAQVVATSAMSEDKGRTLAASLVIEASVTNGNPGHEQNSLRKIAGQRITAPPGSAS